MNRFVLDASVALAWFLDDPVPGLAVQARKSLLRGSRATVPSLWTLDMANGLAIALRSGSLSASFVDRAVFDLEVVLASAIDYDADEITLRQLLSVANLFRLTAYAAAYLETARRKALPLATLDRKLIKAAAKMGVELFS